MKTGRDRSKYFYKRKCDITDCAICNSFHKKDKNKSLNKVKGKKRRIYNDIKDIINIGNLSTVETDKIIS